MNKNNIIGSKKRHINGYSYLSISDFPPKQGFIINNDLLLKATQAQFLLGELTGITKLLPDLNYFISSFITKDATSSSQIEGTRATVVDAFEFASDPKIVEGNDADDIFNYIKALNFGIDRIEKDDFPFVLRFIRELHKNLMEKARSTHFSDPGEFRKTQNWIGGTRPDNADFVPPAPDEINKNLADLEKFIHSKEMIPVIQVAILHAHFETIHPFLDGNGRTGRLLITFYLLHSGLLKKPVLFLSSYFKKHQKVYYKKLQCYHNGDYLSWVDFFLDAVIEIANDSIKLSEQITILRDKDLSRISRIKTRDLDLNVKVLQNIYKSPVISATSILGLTNLTRGGNIRYINKLIEVGVLSLYKKGEGVNPSLYIHKEYVGLFSKI